MCLIVDSFERNMLLIASFRRDNVFRTFLFPSIPVERLLSVFSDA